MSALYAYRYDDWNGGFPEITESTFQSLLVDRTGIPSSPVHCARIKKKKKKKLISLFIFAETKWDYTSRKGLWDRHLEISCGGIESMQGGDYISQPKYFRRWYGLGSAERAERREG